MSVPESASESVPEKSRPEPPKAVGQGPSTCALIERPLAATPGTRESAIRQALSQNFFLKRLNYLYWKRQFRYLYVRFLRMQGSPEAIARGLAAGAFAGSFPLFGFQTIIGIAVAALFRGNKMMAAVGTWISNPLTYVPIIALNFHVGRWLLRLPPNMAVLPSPADGIDKWMDLGMSAVSAMMVGSFLVGIGVSILAYYFGLMVAYRVRSAKSRHRP